MKKRTLTTLPAAFALAALALTGCGSSSDNGSDSSASGSSKSTTVEAAKPMTSADFGTRLQDAQKEAGSYKFTMETGVGGQTQTGTGEAKVDGDKPAVHLTMGSGEQAIETITVDGLYFIKAPMFGTEKPWLKIDPNAKSGFGALVGQMGGNQDPTSLSKAFAKVTKVEAGAEEDVDGETATKYTVTVAGADLAETLKLPAEAAGFLPKEINYDIWVDGEDRPVQMITKLAVQGQESTTTMKFTDYGADVDVEAPPADQVTTKEPAIPGAPAQ